MAEMMKDSELKELAQDVMDVIEEYADRDRYEVADEMINLLVFEANLTHTEESIVRGMVIDLLN